MANKRKARKGAGSRYHGNDARHQPRPAPATNMFTALAAAAASHTDQEMNPHLSERFTLPFRGRNDTHVKHPLGIAAPPLPSANKDIEEYFEDAETPVDGAGSWLDQPEIPLPADILQDVKSDFPDSSKPLVDIPKDIHPRPNKVEGAYNSREDYLQTHHDLLKEDTLGPLRDAVNQVREDPFLDESDYDNSASIGIYDPVYITGMVFSPRGLAVRVGFSLSRVKKFIRWKQSKRLITGTLVVLSPYEDAFRSKCIPAVVAARPLSALEMNPPEIDLFLQPDDLQIDPMKKWIMVESRSSFFEASRHTLSTIKHMMREPFPLSEHLVDVKKHIDPPEYLRKQPLTDLSSLVSMEDAEAFQNVNVLQPESWPSGDVHGLDDSQAKALERILTKRLAIIQGPPGTGKTYVSVVALKVLLANKGDAPIIVTCQTNHALDQLLRHVAEFEPNFIRLGGRSKDLDKVKKRTLFEVKNSMQQYSGPKKKQAMAALRQLTAKMQLLLTPLELGQSCLDHRALVKMDIITEEQAASLDADTQLTMGTSSPDSTPGVQMEQWLGRNLVQSRRPIQADDFGIMFEEEDFDEVEQLQELEAEAVARDDEDIDALKGPVTSLCDNQTGKSPGGDFNSDCYVRQYLAKTPDLTTIPMPHRGGVYKYFQRRTKDIILRELIHLAKQYEEIVQKRKIGQWEDDQQVLASSKLIGMTTTGLNKYRPLIASLRPKIVLVEEAAETLEAPVIAACVPSLNHLILVGDHQQLRPHCQSHKFEDEPYYFNLSLFERMIFNDLEINSLSRQRRMIPEIRRLLRPIYADALQDHHSVKDIHNRPPVEGMGGNNSFFFTHEWPESRNVNMSCQNDMEAQMIVGFFDYLVMNGVDSNQITVLTFYNGQRSLLTKKLRHHQNLRALPLNVCTVDSYQGEENDIVILSLVRSNKKGGIGFLENDNRACVALSRAKRGFYLFGNGEKLAINSNTWSDVVLTMYGKANRSELPETGQQRRVGFMLPLTCTNHGNKTWVEIPDDWELIKGGCDERCHCQLPCGHKCVLTCHPFEKESINCMQQCIKPLQCGHPCSAVCCDPCKCSICEQRSGGVKAIMKRKTAAALPASQVMINAGGVTTANANTSVQMEWKQYADGGARADDARMFQERKMIEAAAGEASRAHQEQEDSTTGRLIENSPHKTNVGVSQNTDLLIDLEGGAPAKAGPRKYRELFTYSSVARGSASASVKGKRRAPESDLLD
ncbi:unnamed protein product [Periconia digitata]|uniref:P-loop containing nucleoside triphosphate hydrolase protein n=1 Tax=Periconia digitata TaxID=1303443 RepID=A0A9W4UU74_9PLEO|nr:unnamed protein product [Periconia digitata]